MSSYKFTIPVVVATIILLALAVPAFAIQYTPGVTAGQYVKYGNFSGSGPGNDVFNDYGFLNYQVVSVSGNTVTLLSTGQYKNGAALPGNNTVDVWNIETGTDNGTPSTQGPIIAANLNLGDPIPPPNTYSVNQTVSGTYLGVSRTVNVLNVTVSTPDYNSTLNYVYDKLSGNTYRININNYHSSPTSTNNLNHLIQRYRDKHLWFNESITHNSGIQHSNYSSNCCLDNSPGDQSHYPEKKSHRAN